jgi:hypothetical protein
MVQLKITWMLRLWLQVHLLVSEGLLVLLWLWTLNCFIVLQGMQDRAQDRFHLTKQAEL